MYPFLYLKLVFYPNLAAVRHKLHIHVEMFDLCLGRKGLWKVGRVIFFLIEDWIVIEMHFSKIGIAIYLAN